MIDPAAVPDAGRRTRVLVVDDYACSRAALAALLTTIPEVELAGVASDARTAIDMVGARRPDVVLMDVRMPGMDGIEATRELKARWPSIKVVLLTVCAAYRTEGLAAGADAFLVKGCPADELVRAVLPPHADTAAAAHRPARPAARRPTGPAVGTPPGIGYHRPTPHARRTTGARRPGGRSHGHRRSHAAPADSAVA